MKASRRQATGKLLRLAATTLLVAAAHRAAAAAQPWQVPVSPEVTEFLTRDLDRLRQAINDPSARQEDRDDAARRLISRRTPDARRIVSDALSDQQNPAAQLAAARALADDPDPDPALIPSLLAAMGANRPLTEAAARALGNYKTNPQVLSQLIDFARRRQANDPARAAVVQAVGSMPDKRAAEFLVGILVNPDETALMRGIAADALSDLSGITEFAQDRTRWQRWWTENAAKPDEQFRADLLARRSARYDQLRQQFAQLSSELRAILNDQYRQAPPAQRPEVLLRLLRSAQPEVRAIGAQIVRDDALDNRFPTEPVKETLRDMIGDSSPTVRMAVAEALSRVNDAAALEALLAQLSQEPDPQVRAALARAVAPINDMRAVPVLLAMLADPSVPAARAAADALRQLGPRIRETEPALAQRTAAELQQALQQRAGTPDMVEFRADLVSAMVPLRQDSLRPVFKLLLDPRVGEGTEVRRHALTGLGEIANPQDVQIIISALDDRSERIRREAVQALAKNPALPENAETLRPRLDPQTEPDEQVRQAAWNALLNVLPELPKPQLQLWADRLKSDPNKRQFAFRALAEKQIRDKDEDGLATTRQSLAAVLLELREYAEAAEYFRMALEYKKTRPGVPAAVIATLMSDRLEALLLAKDYPAAVTFGGQIIAEDAANQQSVGPQIRNQADRLRAAGDFAGALELIAETHKMNPPLGQTYMERLTALQAEIEKQRDRRNQNPGESGARTATGAGAPATRASVNGSGQ